VAFDNEKRNDSVYTRKIKAGKRRTYFFDVRQTKGNDYYVTITESTKRFDDEGFSRHKIYIYKEDFNRFMDNLNNVIDHVKTELMPEYNYEEFARRFEDDENSNNADYLKNNDSVFDDADIKKDEGDGETW
jgi:hypothetical protein